MAELAAILAACARGGRRRAPAHVAAAGARGARSRIGTAPSPRRCRPGERRAVWLGALALRHPAFADLRALAAALAQVTGASFGVLAEGGNAAGAYLAGAVPHRDRRAAARAPKPGLVGLADAAAAAVGLCAAWRRRALGGCARSGAACARSRRRSCVVAITPFVSDRSCARSRMCSCRWALRRDLRDLCQLRGLLAELQRRRGAARRGASGLEGAARARQRPGTCRFEYQSAEEVREEVRRACSESARNGLCGVLERCGPQPQRPPQSSTCRCTRSMRSCGAPPRCSARAKAARRPRSTNSIGHMHACSQRVSTLLGRSAGLRALDRVDPRSSRSRSSSASRS